MGELIWDPRLITREEACALAGPWPVKAAIRQRIWFLDCGKCGLGLLVLGKDTNAFPLTGDGICSAILRHMVTGHGVPLNYRRSDGGGGRRAGAGPAAGDRRGHSGGAGIDPAGDRQPDQERDSGREPGAAAGDPA